MALGKILSHIFSVVLLSVIVVASAGGYGYGPNPKVDTAKTKGQEFIPGVFSVQGIIYGKSGSKIFPLKGGVVRIACVGIDKYGYETAPFAVLSRPTDANGYFLSKLSTEPLEDDGCKISQCKAFLHSSPLKSCQFATDVNNGSSGAPLSAYRAVGSNSMRLYTVGPFVYSSEAQQSTPSGY
ncbi:hypothetical protein BUALT_Bualt02G0237800 [Buddleja alternifolia]|uniref:Uncharacterized protein n=1 Tax=Buddleja alternifolia TaxID=168488 RepID=A0AAV6Y3X2_9LAMI|nr:hypothetical protein BUALT_Bualt02G0237800 [Buddleja alternifolia]